MSNHTTREGWLVAATELLNPVIAERTGLKPKKVRVSCGWPSSRGTSSRNKTIGQCNYGGADKVPNVFISPVLEGLINGEKGLKGYGVLPTLAHELVHAYLPSGTGHKAPFAKAAKKLGLEGKPTSTFASDDFIALCEKMGAELGPYPHAALDATSGNKQGTRLLKVECPECGYVIRVTNKWIQVGTPTCPCGTLMVTEYDHDERLEHIALTDQMQEWTTKDGRFTLRMTAQRNKTKWYLVDWEAPSGAQMLSVDDKYQGLDLMDSIREGLTTLPELADDQDDLPEFEIDLDEEMKLAEQDWRDLQLLDEDEEEFPDHEDSMLTEDERREYEITLTGREAVAA